MIFLQLVFIIRRVVHERAGRQWVKGKREWGGVGLCQYEGITCLSRLVALLTPFNAPPHPHPITNHLSCSGKQCFFPAPPSPLRMFNQPVWLPCQPQREI
ncbi:hypothetical protein ILYODFUR_025094 [Ilyodon furcidens]|uniref:Secreted protein n=1 Tax=Ilyodon furcidens TaxID=33524 RepID=A0ABV0SP43_9TELE